MTGPKIAALAARPCAAAGGAGGRSPPEIPRTTQKYFQRVFYVTNTKIIKKKMGISPKVIFSYL